MASLLARRLRCFYCGQRSASKKSTALREWRCDHCEAVNYLDENGDITDPPTSVTDNAGNSNDIHRSPFDSAGFDQTGLFCSKCIRNQHLLMSALSAYFPDPEDPDYAKYEEAYPRYRSKMEDAYPQVCEKCEQKVNERIRQTGYEAKADHLRRTMERSKMSRAAQKARRRNWRNVLATAGAFGYWASVAGQLLADVIGTADIWDTAAAHQRWPSVTTYTTFIKELLPHTGYSSQDISTVALIAGVLSIWWNPQLRHKVKGINGRIVGLNQYYQCQLIVMVARFAIWAWLQDTRDIEPSLPAAVHAFMILFMSVATIFSQRLVQYDTRPLVLWSNFTPVASPRLQKATAQPASTMNYSNTSSQQGVLQSFPLEKLGRPRENPETEVMRSPTHFSEPDDSMDWTPSMAQEIRPRFVASRPEPTPEVLPSKSLFQGSLPAPPRPPAWQLRNPVAQRRTEIPTPNVFQTSQSNLQRDAAFTAKSRTPDALFAPPKFFAPSDYQATTGLESLFDQTFTIKSPEDDVKGKTALQSHMREDPRQILRSIQFENAVRRIFSGSNILAWSIHTVKPSLLPRDATLMGSLILNILLAGFDLLASLNHSSVSVPKVFYSFVKFLATVILALCLSFNFSGTFHSGRVLELSLRTLTVLHCLEDFVGLYWETVYRKRAKQTSSSSKLASIPPSTHLPSQQPAEPNNIPQKQHSSPPPPTSPTLSYISNPPRSSFSQSQPYGFNGGVAARDRFTDDGSETSEVSGGDSDAETTTSSYTNKSIRHANVFDRDYRDYQSPRSRGLGTGIQGLSLDDSPLAKRTSRVQRSWGTGLDTEPVRRSRRLR